MGMDISSASVASAEAVKLQASYMAAGKSLEVAEEQASSLIKLIEPAGSQQGSNGADNGLGGSLDVRA